MRLGSSVTVVALSAPISSLKSRFFLFRKLGEMGKKSKKSKREVDLPTRTIQSYEDEIAQKLKIIEDLQNKKDKLDVETEELKEYLEANGSAQQDIKDFIEKKVILKEDKIDSMVDIEEVYLQNQSLISRTSGTFENIKTSCFRAQC